MTPQAVYEKLVEAEAAGFFPSQNGPHCAYRGEGGNRCALGVFLTDEEAEAGDRKQWQVLALFDKCPAAAQRLCSGGVSSCTWWLIQRAHDSRAGAEQDSWNGGEFLAEVKEILCV